MMKKGLAVQLLVATLFVLTFHQGAGSGIIIEGAGSPSTSSVFDVWIQGYLNVRDDVSITFTGSGTLAALTAYDNGKLDFIALDRAVPASEVDYGYLTQFPLAGNGLAMAYNLPQLNSTDPTLILSRELTALVWSGDVALWNDSRIQALNPDIAHKLPAEPIVLGYNDNNVLSITEVLRLSLESFSTDFAAQFAAANRTFGNMPPAQRGTAALVGTSTAIRLTWLLEQPYRMTFVTWADAVGKAPLARMINKAGTLVEPSVSAVEAAMDSFSAYYANSQFDIDIYDANDTGAWPLAFMTHFAISQNASSLDCTNVKELLSFLAWIHTNDAASSNAEAVDVAPLPVSFRKKLVNLLGTVACNGEKAYTSSFLIGVGTQITLFTSWAVAWSTDATTMKYYQSLSSTAKDQLVTFDEDYGVVSNGLARSYYELMPDVAIMPAAAYAVVPAYYVPELDGYTLVLDFNTTAAIYLNHVSMWNDQQIKDLNPGIAHLLPAKPIYVATVTGSSAVGQLFTNMLSNTIPEFNATVGVSATARFPVQSDLNRSRSGSDVDFVIQVLRSTPYSFAFWWFHDVLLSRTLNAASMINTAGVVVSPNLTTVSSAVDDYIATGRDLAYDSLVLGKSEGSWPLATFGSFIYRQADMQDCTYASALAEYLVWTQTDAEAKRIADRQGVLLTTSIESMKRDFYLLIKNFTCDGVAASSIHGCITDEGQVCSDAGSCVDGACLCDSGREGAHCESFTSDSLSDTLAIALGVGVPLVTLAFVGLMAFIIVLLVMVQRKGKNNDNWEIRYDELDMGEHLGTGGFGEVHRATWKGTEVAVKVMASDRVTKEMEKSFKDEVRVMTALRHPNVVLFMAASTKAPKMCIVMEFMSLGSLFDLLHNELIPEIPFALKAKMAYQASKGMHFLHSSGIVHRDLKSLNLLLDNKWNVKVSDFGLTKFKEDIKSKGMRDIAGSVHWTAPEVLNESQDVDFILADVYSFGIILWELLTRAQPYYGMSPAAVAVAVIRDNLRPRMPEDSLNTCPAEFEELITSCWHHDPTIRPTFLEIMTRLSSMHGDSTSGGATSFTSKTSSSSSGSGPVTKPNKGLYSSWTLPSASTHSNSSTSNSSSSGSNNYSGVAAGGVGGVRAPEGEVAIVFTDITRAASLWEFNAAAMRDATLLHNETLRSALARHRGYEVVFIRDRNSGEGSFCMAFQQVADALAWCCEVQRALVTVEWPEALLEHPGAAEEWGDTDDRVLYKGLRVRMGVHVGQAKAVRDPMTRRVEYIGPTVNAAARITALTHGGQIVMSHVAWQKLKESTAGEVWEATSKRVLALGNFEIPDSPQGAKLYELKADGLEARFFGGVTLDGDNASSSNNPSSVSGSGSGSGSLDERELMQTAVGDGMMFKEDTFLTSANLCRWIIDFGEIQIGKQIGLGSYGVVYRGKWKGVDVAVKRFIKQKLDERRMLEFRAEMAFLSELHHPNIVLFIGACVKKPNLCIVTEFMKQGSLKDILGTNSVKLTWKQKLRMLRSAALGINYLHSLHPVIVHRDLKPSNLLVDENWNVKVADFGFARIKEENATMTRCGTPCWTAPEIIRGDKYDERADVYSFGIVMWQVVTRREPYAGRNFMGVSLDVLEGKRPQIPNDCPPAFRKLMKKCWHATADKRPRMEQIVELLDQHVGDDDNGSEMPSAMVGV